MRSEHLLFAQPKSLAKKLLSFRPGQAPLVSTCYFARCVIDASRLSVEYASAIANHVDL